jgi:hypothetical protein
MPLSIQQDRSGPDWPLGCVVVAANGTPVNIMKNVDPNNNNAPGTINTGNVGGEYTATCHMIGFQGYHPGANNNGMVINNGPVYVLRAPAGGTGNRSDSGAIVKILAPGSDFLLPASAESILAGLSPYRYWIDSDFNGDGALITLWGAGQV